RRPHPQLRISNPAAHRLLHELGEDLTHLVRLRDDVDTAEKGLGNPAYLGNLPVDADATTVALELARHAHDRVRQLLGRLVVVFTVGEQDRMPLYEFRYGVEQPASQREPGSHR